MSTPGEQAGAAPDLAEMSYERLAAIRSAAAALHGSGVLWIHERTHLAQIIARIDAAVRLKHERDAYRAGKAARDGDPPR